MAYSWAADLVQLSELGLHCAWYNDTLGRAEVYSNCVEDQALIEVFWYKMSVEQLKLSEVRSMDI